MVLLHDPYGTEEITTKSRTLLLMRCSKKQCRKGHLQSHVLTSNQTLTDDQLMKEKNWLKSMQMTRKYKKAKFTTKTIRFDTERNSNFKQERTIASEHKQKTP